MTTEDYIVEIEEYKSRDFDDLNEAKDVSYLKKDCFRYSEFGISPYKITELRNNNVRIENSSYSGIIQLDKIRLHFSTKVKTNLFYMLSFLKDEKCFHYDPETIIDIKEGPNFFDILGRLFLNELESIFKKGFYKKYVRKEENVSFLKGKFLIKKQVQNEIKKRLKFYCCYEDLTYDNLENQIILRATTLLFPLISRFNDKIKRDLIRYSNLMRDEVSLVNVLPEDCEKVQISRLNEYYETIIQFSKAILLNYFIRSTHKGFSKGFNFIVNMNRVYEDFITEIVKELVEEEDEFKDFIAEPQERFSNLVRENKIITKPDLILRKKDTGNIPLIIDAKYKRQENNADYFQVIAYSLAIPTAKACFLIYPDNETIEAPILTLDPSLFGNKRSEIKLYAIKIDLLLSENLEYKAYIGKIKDQVKNKLLVGDFLNVD